MKKWLAIILKTAVSGGLIWYLVTNVDMSAVRAHAETVDVGLLVLSGLVFLLQFPIGGMRWNSVLRALGRPLPAWLAARLFYIGMFFNQALPGGTGGDAVRMYLAYKQDELDARTAINGVIIERVGTVLALVILVDVTQFQFISNLSAEMTRFSLLAVTVVSIVAIGGVALLMLLNRLPERLRKWRVVRGLGHLGEDTQRVFGSLTRAARPLAWSLLGHANVSLACFVMASALGLSVTLLDCLVLIPPVLLVMSVPISIGGWGVREGAMVWMFALVGVSQDAALTLSLFFGVVSLADFPAGRHRLAGDARRYARRQPER